MNQKEQDEIDNLFNYLKNNKYHIGHPNDKSIINNSYALFGFGIDKYFYPLQISGIDYTEIIRNHQLSFRQFLESFDTSNIFIRDIPLPQNKIEEKLYQIVRDFLTPYLPIKIDIELDKFDDCYYFELVNKDIPIVIGFSSFDDAILPIYFLNR